MRIAAFSIKPYDREFLAAGIAITAATAVFLGVLVLGLAYEFKRGALEWEK